MASDIHIGDMLYDCEAEGNLIGWVAERKYAPWWLIQWNDGSSIQLHNEKIRELKKEWHKLRKKCLTKKKK